MDFCADIPFIFLADVILLGKIDEICDRFGREKGKSVYDVNLCAIVPSSAFRPFEIEKVGRDRVMVRIRKVLKGMLGRYSRLDELDLIRATRSLSSGNEYTRIKGGGMEWSRDVPLCWTNRLSEHPFCHRSNT
jgi:hypothetical protein